jgi:hypothetical protein
VIAGGYEAAKEIAYPAARAGHSRRIAIQHERPVDCRLSGIEIMPEIRNRIRGEMQRGRITGESAMAECASAVPKLDTKLPFWRACRSGLEHLANSAQQLLSRRGYTNVGIRIGDGQVAGLSMPYDKIMVTAAAEEVQHRYSSSSSQPNVWSCLLVQPRHNNSRP